jgi:RNA polymerase sigma-70 factor (ECF subfamily)
VALLNHVPTAEPVAEPTSDDQREAEAFLPALVRGRPWAAEEAWHRYSPMVYGLLRRGLGPTADLDDAMEEVFLRLYRRVKMLRDATALRSFVFSIAVRVLRGQLRRRFIRRSVLLSRMGDLSDVVEPPLDVEAREALRRVYTLFDKLRPLDRTIFVLRQADGMSLPEIASVVEVSLSTVKRRLARTNTRMRHLIEADALLSTYFDPKTLGIGLGGGHD